MASDLSELVKSFKLDNSDATSVTKSLDLKAPPKPRKDSKEKAKDARRQTVLIPGGRYHDALKEQVAALDSKVTSLLGQINTRNQDNFESFGKPISDDNQVQKKYYSTISAIGIENLDKELLVRDDSTSQAFSNPYELMNSKKLLKLVSDKESESDIMTPFQNLESRNKRQFLKRQNQRAPADSEESPIAQA